MFLAAMADGKTAASDNCKTTLRRREEKLPKSQPKHALGWALIGCVLGRSLRLLEGVTTSDPQKLLKGQRHKGSFGENALSHIRPIKSHSIQAKQGST